MDISSVNIWFSCKNTHSAVLKKQNTLNSIYLRSTRYSMIPGSIQDLLNETVSHCKGKMKLSTILPPPTGGRGDHIRPMLYKGIATFASIFFSLLFKYCSLKAKFSEILHPTFPHTVADVMPTQSCGHLAIW